MKNDIQKGLYAIPTRLYLDDSQRDKLMNLVRTHQVDIPDLVTELVVSFLDHLPESDQWAFMTADPEDISLESELQKRRAEVLRLRRRMARIVGDVPGWFTTYIASLEQEIQHLEAAHAEESA